MRHYFDVCAEVTIGSDTIIAGVRSTFYTHSKGIDEVDYVKQISISDWCYIGSNTCFVPGASIGSHSFVGMGAVIVGDHTGETYVLLAGNPASVRKQLVRDCAYYRQEKIIHPHMK
jgi:acetyltransferase-like isoleucine patch superfamily enzyme